ncbi:MAG: DUF1822 family protein [Cyanobacteria bacterium P01_F01_bin.143]
MTTNPSQNLVRLEDSIAETNLVAIIRQEPAEITKLQELEFNRSYDDLDYLVFATLSLPSGHKVALVRHENSPAPGTEICVKYNQPNVAVVIKEALTEMNLSPNDLTWIHPEHEQKLNKLKVFRTVNLANWLKNSIEEEWQTLEEVLGSRQGFLLFSARGVNMTRAIAINFREESTSISVAFVVRIIEHYSDNLAILLEILSLDHQSCLPLNLKLAVLDYTGNLFTMVESINQDIGLRLNIGCCLGDRFSVTITLDDEKKIFDFVA